MAPTSNAEAGSIATDLHTACETGDEAAVRRCLESDPRAVDAAVDGYFPIQRAIPKHPHVVRLLLEAGDDSNRPLSHVHWFDWEDAAARQIANGWRPIHMAALHGYGQSVECLRVLHEFGADLSCPSPLGGSRPIHLAATPGFVLNVEFLISAGVDVDQRTSDAAPSFAEEELMNTKPFEPFDGAGSTALMVAAGEGFPDLAACLIDHGADVNAANRGGFTPLHFAAGGFWREREPQYCEIIKLLLSRGADAGAKDSQNRVPKELGESKNRTDAARLLALS